MKSVLSPEAQAFSNLLSKYNFDTFGTFTTRRPLSLPGARRMAERFAVKINAGQTTSMFWAAEPFDTREGFHFHGLLKLGGFYTPTDLWQYWTNEMKYGRSQFLPVSRKFGTNAVENYCAKYISKHLSDYDIYIGVQPHLGGTKTGVPERPEYIKPFEKWNL